MNRTDAEKIITEYLKPIFGFALKRCRSIHDAEDLSQEIVTKVFRAFLIKDDVGDVNKYIWTAAHNTLNNYYRDSVSVTNTVSIDDVAEQLSATDDLTDINESEIAISHLQSEIAYLSKLQRYIVIAYYFENRKQADIAKELNIPLGTVKWHLFEAKKELKRSITMTRNYGELKFKPIQLTRISCNGSPGTKGNNANFFRSALSQNIAYSVRNAYKSINEIADELGVSPVYVESEAEFLYEYGFLLKKGDNFISNIIIDEADDEIIRIHDDTYSKATALYADELFDALSTSGLLKDNRILGGKFGVFSMTTDPPKDENFLLWSLIPYITANSGRHLLKETVSFDEAAALRPDGGHNICSANVFIPDAPKPMYNDSMEKFCGCCWNSYENILLWQCDSEWSEKRINEDYPANSMLDLMLLKQWVNDTELSVAEYVRLAERGYISMLNKNGDTKIITQVVTLENPDIKASLLAIGGKIKEKHWEELCRLKDKFIDAILAKTPPHLHKARIYGLQHIFFADPWFIIYVLKHLTGNGKLKLPTNEQKKMLMTVIEIDK